MTNDGVTAVIGLRGIVVLKTRGGDSQWTVVMPITCRGKLALVQPAREVSSCGELQCGCYHIAWVRFWFTWRSGVGNHAG